MSNGAEPRGSIPPAGANPSYRVVRELAKRAQRAWAAIREKNELVVVQRFTKAPRPASAPFGETAYDKAGATFVPPDAMAIILRDSRCLSKNWHPNVSRVRHVDLASDDLTIATELVEGATLADLIAAARAKRANEKDPILAFPLLARVVVDVLGGLHGLHGLRDGMNAPLNVFHGEICPANIIIGKDGVARVSHVFRPRPVKVEARSEGLGYASPETLGGEQNQDARADIYSVGAMLWEGLTGRRLYDETDPTRIAQRQREEELEPPSVASSSAFARLSEVATRALAFDPALRFRTASEMATEIRRIAGTRLAPGSAVAQTVMELAGDRIRARRAELDQSSSGARRAFGAASMPPPTVSAKDLPKRDTQIIDDDGEKTQVDEQTQVDQPSPAATLKGLGSDPMTATKAAKSPAPAPVAAARPAPTPAPTTTAAAPASAATPARIGLPSATSAKVPTPRTTATAPKAKDPPKVVDAPKVIDAPKPSARSELSSTPDDLLGPRGSDPNIMDGPLVAATVTATALSLTASKEVALAEKSLVDMTPVILSPPPSPFALTPSAAPPPSTAPHEPMPVLMMPRAAPAPAPFPLTPSARPPAYQPKLAPDPVAVGAHSERIDLESVDVLEAANPELAKDLAPPEESSPNVGDGDGAKRESGGEPVAGMALGADGEGEADAALTQRRKKLRPIFAAVAGLMVLVLVVAGIASLTGSKDPQSEKDKTGSASSSTTTTTTATATASATSTETPAATATETATRPTVAETAPTPPPSPAPDPTPEPAAAKAPDPPPAAAPAPAPKPTTNAVAASPPRSSPPSPTARPTAPAAAPPKKPKKSSYEPSGI